MPERERTVYRVRVKETEESFWKDAGDYERYEEALDKMDLCIVVEEVLGASVLKVTMLTLTVWGEVEKHV